MTRRIGTVVAVLGSTQTLAWASSFYLPAILGAPIAHAPGIAPTLFFALFSGAAATAPIVGQLIDRHGGRAVLACSNLVLAAGLALLGLAQGVLSLGIAWVV